MSSPSASPADPAGGLAREKEIEAGAAELTGLPPSSEEDEVEVIERRRAVALNTLKAFYGLRDGSIDDLLGALAEAHGTHPPGLQDAASAASPAAAPAAIPELTERA